MSRPRGAPVRIQRNDFTPEDAAERARRLGIGDELGRLTDARLVPIDQVHPNPEQPRKTIDAAALEELAGSIRVRGILQPLRLRRLPNGYQIVAGERRWRAARLAGLPAVPAIVVEQDEANAFVDALIENVVREDLNPLERADAVRRLRPILGVSSWDEVAQAVGVSRRTVYLLLGIAELPPKIQEDVRAGDLGLKQAEALRQLGRRPDLQEQAYRRIVEDGLSGDDALALARTMRQMARPAVQPAGTPNPKDESPKTAPASHTPLAASPEHASDRLPGLGRELRAIVGAIRAETDRPLPAADRAALLIDLDWAQRTIDAIRSRIAP